MPIFPRFNKIFIYLFLVVIFIIFIFANLPGCGNQSGESSQSGNFIDPGLIYNENTGSEPSTEIISGTLPFSSAENTTVPQTTKIPETSKSFELSEIPEITDTDMIEITEEATAAVSDLALYVITPSGKKYHYPTCRTVKTIKDYLTKEEAEQLGYEPCKICNPQ